MVIGVLELELGIPAADSLKAKRMVIRSLKDRIRRKFNVSVAEVADQDLWQAAVLAVVVVNSDRRFANQLLSQVVNFVEHDHHDAVLEDYQLSFR